MNVLYSILGLNVLIIFWFRRDLLLHIRPCLFLLVFNLALFIAAFLLPKQGAGDPRFIVLLKLPFLYQLLFLFMLVIFRLLYHRDPVDTFWTSDTKLFRHGVFNFIFVVAICPLVIFLY